MLRKTCSAMKAIKRKQIRRHGRGSPNGRRSERVGTVRTVRTMFTITITITITTATTATTHWLSAQKLREGLRTKEMPIQAPNCRLALQMPLSLATTTTSFANRAMCSAVQISVITLVILAPSTKSLHPPVVLHYTHRRSTVSHSLCTFICLVQAHLVVVFGYGQLCARSALTELNCTANTTVESHCSSISSSNTERSFTAVLTGTLKSHCTATEISEHICGHQNAMQAWLSVWAAELIHCFSLANFVQFACKCDHLATKRHCCTLSEEHPAFSYRAHSCLVE